MQRVYFLVSEDRSLGERERGMKLMLRNTKSRARRKKNRRQKIGERDTEKER